MKYLKHPDISEKEWRDYPEVNSHQLQMLIDHFIETAVEIDVIDPNNPKNYFKN